MSRISQPSGRCTLMTSCAPICALSAAVCVLVNRSDTVSGSLRTMLGVVRATPAEVLSVQPTNQSVKSTNSEHGPSSWSRKEKSQSVPRWMVEDVWTATITTQRLRTSKRAAPSHGYRNRGREFKIVFNHGAVWVKGLGLPLRNVAVLKKIYVNGKTGIWLPNLAGDVDIC